MAREGALKTCCKSLDGRFAFALAVVAGAMYARSLGVGFFSDDFYFLGRNAPVLERPLFMFHIFYRDFIPAVHLSFAVDRLLAFDWAPLYHVTSLLIHAITTGLVYRLCRTLEVRPRAAAIVTLLWALNPHISETVIWVAARGHSLATLFLVAAFITLRGPARLGVGLALALVALGAKETALFPLVLTPLLHREHRIWWRAVAIFAPLCVAFAVFNVVAKPKLFLAQAAPVDFLLQVPFLLLRPLGLDGWYDHSPLAALTVGVVFAAMALMWRRPAARIGLGWLALSLIPIVLQPIYSSRYFYLLTVGYALLAGALIESLNDVVTSPAARRLMTATGAVLLSLFLVADILFIQREIEDYRLLSAPYMAVMGLLTAPLRSLNDGDVLAILDVGPRAAIAELHSTIGERGNIDKLIPFRRRGVNGTAELLDLANAVRPFTRGTLAYPGDLSLDRPTRWMVYDGQNLHELTGDPPALPPPERILVVGVGPAELFFERNDDRLASE